MSTSMPTINPTGTNFLPKPGASTGGSTGAFQFPFGGTGGPGNFGFGNATNPNPPGTGPTTPVMNPSPTGPLPVGVPGSGVEQLPTSTANELGKIFGKGLGSLYQSLIQSQGGYNSGLTQQSVDAQIQAMQEQIQRGWGQTATQLGETGISPDSSVYALTAGDYFSNVTAQENAITAAEYFNMWNQSQNREFGLVQDLIKPGSEYQANKPGILGQVGQWLGLGTGVAGAIGSAASAGGAGTWADVLMGLAFV